MPTTLEALHRPEKEGHVRRVPDATIVRSAWVGTDAFDPKTLDIRAIQSVSAVQDAGSFPALMEWEIVLIARYLMAGSRLIKLRRIGARGRRHYLEERRSHSMSIGADISGPERTAAGTLARTRAPCGTRPMGRMALLRIAASP